MGIRVEQGTERVRGLTYARYVGRVGALAVALGVGAAVATTPGIAFADNPASNSPDTTAGSGANEGDGDNSSPGSANDGAGGVATDGSSLADAGAGSGSGDGGGDGANLADTDDIGDDVGGDLHEELDDPPGDEDSVGPEDLDGAHPGGEEESTEPPAEEQPAPSPQPTAEPEPEAVVAPPSGSQYKAVPDGAADESTPVASEPVGQLEDGPAVALVSPPAQPVKDSVAESISVDGAAPLVGTNALRAANVDTVAPAAAAAPQPTFFETLIAIPGTAISAVLNLVSSVLEPIIGPNAPFDTPALWAIVGWVRREFDATFANHTPTLNPYQSSDVPNASGQVTGGFGGNDADGDPLTYSVPATGAGAPAHGSVAIDQATGSWTYTPDAGWNRSTVLTDSFTVTAADTGSHVHALGQTHATSATVSVTVAAVNSAPVAVDDGATVAEGGSATIAVLANDSDSDGTLDVSSVVVTQPAHGTATVHGDGTVTYASDGSEVISDAFSYTVADNNGAVSNPAAVSVVITPVDDGPTAVDDTASIRQDASSVVVDVLANDTDVDGGPKQIVSITQPANGTATITGGGAEVEYRPSGTFTGVDSFTYTVNGGSTGQVAVTVQPNAAPQFETSVVGLDTAEGSVTYTVSASDDTVAAADLAVTVTQPEDGTGTVSTPQYDAATGTWAFVYTPQPQERLDAYSTPAVDQDVITVSVSDGNKATTRTVDVTIDPVAVAITDISSATVTNGADPRVTSSLIGDDGSAVAVVVTGTGATDDPYRTTVVMVRPGAEPVTVPVDGYPLGAVVVGADGTASETVLAGTGTTDDPYRTTVVAVRPGAEPLIVAVDGHPYEGGVGADGTIYQTVYTGAGAPDDPYRTTVVVVRPGAEPLVTAPVDGYPYYGGVGADGTVYQTVYTGTGAPDDPHRTAVVVVRPGEEPVITAPVDGYPQYGGAGVGADGTIYLTMYSGTGTVADPYSTAVVVMRPGAEPLTVSADGYPYDALVVGADGAAYQTVLTGTGTTGDSYGTVLVVVRPGVEPLTVSVDGLPTHGMVVGADGAAYQTVVSGSGTTDDPYGTTVVVVRPGVEPVITAPVDGLPYGGRVVVGADGTAYQTVVTGTGSTDDPYGTTVVMLRPGVEPLTVSVDGVPADEVVVGADGTAYQTVVSGSGTTDDPYGTTVVVLRPGVGPVITAPVYGRPYGGRVVVGADGTAYQTVVSGSGTTDDPYGTTVVVLRPGAEPLTVSADGYPNDAVVVGADGTAYQTVYSGSGTTDDPYGTTLVVLRPGAEPLTVSADGYPNDAVVVGADGTAYQTVYTGTGTTDDPYRTTMVVVRPGVETVITAPVDGLPWAGVVVGADGTAYQTVYTGTGRLDDPYRTTVLVTRPGAEPILTVPVNGYPSGGAVRFDGDGSAHLIVSQAGGPTDLVISELTIGVAAEPAETVV